MRRQVSRVVLRGPGAGNSPWLPGGFPSSPLHRPLRAPEWQRKMLAAWALSPARPTPIHPRRERRGFPAFFGEVEKLRCSACGERFTAPLPKEVGDEK